MESGMQIEQFKALVGHVEEDMARLRRLNSQASALEAQTNLSNELSKTIEDMRKELAQDLQAERQRAHQLLMQNSELSSKLIKSKAENESIRSSVRSNLDHNARIVDSLNRLFAGLPDGTLRDPLFSLRQQYLQVCEMVLATSHHMYEMPDTAAAAPGPKTKVLFRGLQEKSRED
eukprot:767684-Hanusia_phi.AAC.4